MNMVQRVMRRVSFALSVVLGLAVFSGLPATASAATLRNGGGAQLFSHSYSLKYVALGDSVAAGLGLPVAPNASAEDKACGRSPSAYAATVAGGLNTKLSRFGLQISTANVACQGAVVDNLTQTQTRGDVTVRPQLESAFAQDSPTLITLTIGANDAHWAEFIGACFAATNCDTEANTAAANAYLSTMQTKLSATLDGIWSRSGFIPPATVVTGYYNPISAQCINANLTASEIAWLNQETDAFNNALRTAAEQVGWFARFAPVDFTGHDICSADPWIQRPGVPGELAPFHPTARGQQAMGEAVLDSFGF